MVGHPADAGLPVDHHHRGRLGGGYVTPKQRALAIAAYRFPVILDHTTSLIARHLEHKGLGTIEDGASDQVIFRLNQAGCDVVATLHSLADNEKASQDHV